MAKQTICTAALLTLTLTSSAAVLAQTSQPVTPPEAKKAGLDYFAVNTSLLEHRSLGTDHERAMTTALGVVMGTYLTDMIKVEGRAGLGVIDDDPAPELTVGLKYYASWYMGIQYPWLDFSNVYVQYGFSHVRGKATVRERDRRDPPNPYRRVTGDLMSSSFSVSWLVGTDLEISKDTFLVFEGGRLHNDTQTDSKTFQFNFGARYEF
ncbi:MAG: porin family protein [Gammaproteobacteria bacterium]|nr:porin family protein [Gammaproteobacteria bacterium]